MIDFTKLQLLSSASSNKVLDEDSESFSVGAALAGAETFGVATIPHDFGSDNLLIQVAINSTTVGAVIDETVLPWSSNDNRRIAYTRLDSTNLYIFIISNATGGAGIPAFTANYTYRILVP